MSAVRSRAEAGLAELEILHHRQLAGVADAAERERLAAGYRAERQRVEDRRERELTELRARS